MSLQAVTTEKRQFNRIAFDAPVTLHDDKNQWGSKLIDISLKGALITKPDNWNQENNNSLNLTIQLDENDLVIDMEVSLAHSDDKQLGFKCENIGLDSITTLRRLVELNLGDETLLERDISNMITL